MRGIPRNFDDEIELLKNVECNINGTLIKQNGKIWKIYDHPEGYKYVCIKGIKKPSGKGEGGRSAAKPSSAHHFHMFRVHWIVAIKFHP